jgi:serine/threonine-protein kinase
VVKLLDFGLAKRGAGGDSFESDEPKTGATNIVGTVEYMAPEQARAEPVTPRSDLYALGVLAFELLTGQLPFRGQVPAEILRQHLESPPPAPSTRVDGVPAALDALVVQLMAKDPGSRPASAEEVREALAAIERELVRANPRPAPARADATTLPSGEASVKHRRWLLRLAVAAALSVVSALVAALASRTCAGH